MNHITYVGGTFDLFHIGHLNLLARCKAQWPFDKLVVAVNSDDFAASYKRTPVVPEAERLAIVQAIEYVDEAFIMKSHAMQWPMLQAIDPVRIVHGTDWQGASLARQLGIPDSWEDRLVYLPYTPGISTTDRRSSLG